MFTWTLHPGLQLYECHLSGFPVCTQECLYAVVATLSLIYAVWHSSAYRCSSCTWALKKDSCLTHLKQTLTWFWFVSAFPGITLDLRDQSLESSGTELLHNAVGTSLQKKKKKTIRAMLFFYWMLTK